MLHYDTFYNRNQIVKHSGLSREAVEELCRDIPAVQIGTRRIYSGLEILKKLYPNEEFEQLKEKLKEKKGI